jgi:hypothetical protein
MLSVDTCSNKDNLTVFERVADWRWLKIMAAYMMEDHYFIKALLCLANMRLPVAEAALHLHLKRGWSAF